MQPSYNTEIETLRATARVAPTVWTGRKNSTICDKAVEFFAALCYNVGKTPKGENPMTIVLGIIFALAALIFLAVGYMAMMGGVQQKKRCTASAPGTVTAVRLQTQARGRGKQPIDVYTPEFTFEGQTHRSSFSSLRKEFKEGQAVTVRYDPADPSFFYVEGDPNASSQGGIMCLIIGMLLAVAAVAMFI